MCTVSWIFQGNGYQLLCNRDEKRTRGRAAEPRISKREGVRLMAPRDSDFGGTWIASNEFGVTLCLLNGPVSAGGGGRSRGLLVEDLAVATSAPEVVDRISNIDLAIYRPFTLAVLAPAGTARVVAWSGRDCTIADGDSRMPLVSSSFDSDAVRDFRLQEFERRQRAAGRLDAGVLRRFHASHGAGPDAYSPCMHRSDAETVSFSIVCVGDSDVDLFYSPASPCRKQPGKRTTLLRRRA